MVTIANGHYQYFDYVCSLVALGREGRGDYGSELGWCVQLLLA